jgi:hypothetical protein
MRITSLLERVPYGRVLNDSKDRLLSSGVKNRVNHLIKPYGTMLDFHINTTDRSISLSVLLKGEQSPVNVTIKEYEIISEEGKTYLRFPNLDTSREWLTTVAREKLSHQKIPLPDNVSWLTKLLA